MAKVVFNLELGIRERVANVVCELQTAGELVAQRLRRQIRDVSDHTRQAHACIRRAARPIVMAALPIRIGHDRVARNGVPRDALRLQRGRTGDDHDRVDLIRIQDGPFERLHAAQRSTGDGGEPRDPDLVEECAFGPHHVGDCDHRKVGSVRFAGCGVHGRWAGRPPASTEKIRADHEKLIGIEGFTGTDHAVPPAEAAAGIAVAILGGEPVPGALLRRRLREPGCVRIAAQCVADENHVVARRRQCAVRLVGDADRMQRSSAVEREGFREIEKLRVDRADRARGDL